MPVIIDDECDVGVVSTAVPIILAEFRFGPLLSNDDVIIIETRTIDIRIEYAEFIHMMYSNGGDFSFRPSALNVYNYLLIEYGRSHDTAISCYTSLAHEDRTLTTSNLLASRDLHSVINGPFKACIDVVAVSSVLQFGIKQRTVFSVASAPYTPTLKLCNDIHIYQIVMDRLCDC